MTKKEAASTLKNVLTVHGAGVMQAEENPLTSPALTQVANSIYGSDLN